MPKRIQWTYDNARTMMAEAGCELLTPRAQWKNSKTQIRYMCKCKQEATVGFSCFLANTMCRLCIKKAKPERVVVRKKWTYDTVKALYESYGCTLHTPKEELAVNVSKTKLDWSRCRMEHARVHLRAGRQSCAHRRSRRRRDSRVAIMATHRTVSGDVAVSAPIISSEI